MLPRELREARIVTAMNKVVRVLRREVVCHQKELERRVCEVGFRYYPKAEQKDRPEPVHLNEARNRLRRRDIIDLVQRTVHGNGYNFWHLVDEKPTVVAAALGRKLQATGDFDVVHHNGDLSGFAAEQMFWNALGQASDWFRLPWVQGQDITRVNGHEADHGVDLAAVHMPSQIRIVVQVKNTREWYYPNSPTIWQLLGSAAQLDAVPVLIARQVAEPTFIFMDHVGGFVVPTFNTYIHQDARRLPEWASFQRAALTLGYKDVKVMDPQRPETRHVATFSARLPPRLPDMRASFSALAPEVVRLAIDEGLQEANLKTTLLSGEARDDAFHAFWSRIRAEAADSLHPDTF